MLGRGAEHEPRLALRDETNRRLRWLEDGDLSAGNRRGGRPWGVHACDRRFHGCAVPWLTPPLRPRGDGLRLRGVRHRLRRAARTPGVRAERARTGAEDGEQATAYGDVLQEMDRLKLRLGALVRPEGVEDERHRDEEHDERRDTPARLPAHE